MRYSTEVAHRGRRPRCSPRFYTSIESEKWSRITNLSSYAIKCTAQYRYICAEEDKHAYAKDYRWSAAALVVHNIVYSVVLGQVSGLPC